MSYVLIVAFHPYLNFRNYCAKIDYLANDQMVQQLSDIAQEVCRRKCKNALD